MVQSPHHEALRVEEIVSALREADLLETVRGRSPGRQAPVRDLSSDSRAAEGGSLFVAIRGAQVDGHEYLADAVRRGARVLVAEHAPAGGWSAIAEETTVLQVDSSRRALAVLADRWFGLPARNLRLIGVTGTNGKTTTASLTWQLLEAAGLRAGWIGTVGARYAGRTVSTDLTTPGPLRLHELLHRMREAGCEAAVLELSSHALDQVRIAPEVIGVGVFTNLSHDHLDYHGSFAAYRRAKQRLFAGLSGDATAVVNGDDPEASFVTSECCARVFTYGAAPTNDLGVRIRAHTMDGLELELDGFSCRLPFPGRYNALNLAAAYGASRAIGGVDEARIREAISELRPVAGRMEQFATGDGRRVVVDYAHTPDALANVLEAVREAAEPSSRIWCVFGCGGDRDVEKRSKMGRIAEEGADRVVVTSDNPRSEDPRAIIAQILAGLEAPEEAITDVDRERAVRYAAEHSEPGDVVLVAGRGHETVQEIAGERRPLDDRQVVRRWFDVRQVTASSSHRP